MGREDAKGSYLSLSEGGVRAHSVRHRLPENSFGTSRCRGRGGASVPVASGSRKSTLGGFERLRSPSS